MKKTFALLLLLLFACPAFALTIATGVPEGTYFKIAQDIQKLAVKENIPLEIVSTNGSFDNMNLLGTGKVDLAIVQLDALKYASTVVQRVKGTDLFEKIRVILNLYPEEIHVISANKGITTFYHLDGKRVSVGPQTSGTALTADLLLKAYDVKVEKSNDDPKDAVKRLADGQLDAMLFVGGAPIPLFQQLDKRFHFVHLPHNAFLDQMYPQATIGKQQYKWAEETQTYMVPSVIVGLERNDPPYIESIQRLVLAVLSNKAILDAKGHPKWRDSYIKFLHPDVGYGPTNAVIETFDVLERYGYRIQKIEK